MNHDQPHDDHTRSFVGFAPGTVISHYKIVSKVGAGGMGEVYLAEDTDLRRRVALKFLPNNLSSDPHMRKRFKREAQAAAMLDHPNIVPIYEVGEHDSNPFFSMAHVEGQSLTDVIRGESVKINRACEIGMQICEGLKAAHDKGIVHRDIKPSNILIDSTNRVRIVDFGLASMAATDNLTKAGSTIGTLGYMSPEQVQGDKTDARADLFSFGVVLYELVAGQAPFTGDNHATIMNSILNHRPAAPSELRSDLPPRLQNVIMKLLEKSPEHRYQSAGEVSDDLRSISLQAESGIFAAESETPSIAVLPFANLSNDPEQEYFCDGIAEEVINALTNVTGLRVVARTSAFAFKGQNKDIRQIGRALGVSTILEGSVRKAADKIRVTGQLINVDDGFHMWSERYDRTLDDVFAIQDDISLAIVNQLKIKLLKGEEQAIRKRTTTNMDAHNLYLKGRYFWNQRTKKTLKRSVSFFEQAIALDPEYAQAYNGLAESYAVLFSYDSDEIELGQKANAMAEKALEIDSSLSEPYCTLAMIAFLEWRWEDSVAHFQKSLALNPNYATANHWWALALHSFGKFDKAMEFAEKARRLDPLSIAIGMVNSFLYLNYGQYEKAIAMVEEYKELGENLALYHLVYAFSQAGLGRADDARKHIDKAQHLIEAEQETVSLSRNSKIPVAIALSLIGDMDYGIKLLEEILSHEVPTSDLLGIAQLLIIRGELDKGIEFFEKALDARANIMWLNNFSPSMGAVKDNPRYLAAIERTGILSVKID